MVAAGVDTVITDRLSEALAAAGEGRAERLRGDTRTTRPDGLVTGPNGGERPCSTKMVGHERRRMRQTDT